MTEIVLSLWRAIPIGTQDIYRLDAKTVPMCVLHKHDSGVETHRLVVEDGDCEDRKVIELRF